MQVRNNWKTPPRGPWTFEKQLLERTRFQYFHALRNPPYKRRELLPGFESIIDKKFAQWFPKPSETIPNSYNPTQKHNTPSCHKWLIKYTSDNSVCIRFLHTCVFCGLLCSASRFSTRNKCELKHFRASRGGVENERCGVKPPPWSYQCMYTYIERERDRDEDGL